MPTSLGRITLTRLLLVAGLGCLDGRLPPKLHGGIRIAAAYRGWRSECDVEGVDVRVTLGAPARADEAAEPGQVCQVAYLTYEDLTTPGLDLSGTDIIFTSSLAHVPFMGRRGQVHFLENVSEFYTPEDLDEVMREKSELLSILLPPPEEWTELIHAIHGEAQLLLPEHIYIDDGSLERHTEAFLRYRFSLIADDMGNHTVSDPLVRSIGFHTIPLFNGFVELSAMAFNGVADFPAPIFSLQETLTTVRRHNEHLGTLWHYHRIVQDHLQYRYNRPFQERLFSQACVVCRLWAPVASGAPAPPLVYVGIYSARANLEKRQTIRETWGRVLRDVYGLRYVFFLGHVPAGATALERQVRQEADEHGDLVFLEASEGYRMNSRKGLLFLEWIATRTEAEFLLKVDDDVYFRPAPLLEQLRNRPPASYVWGYFDYISPVPREEGDNFYNTWEDYPFEVFAPYPRGVVRVLSMDLVRLVAKASREMGLKMIFGDDPCIGYHFRQLLFDEDEPLPSISLDDFDNRVFAMEPSCHKNLWSKITGRTWAIHHVSPEQVRCMWAADVEAGYYAVAPGPGGAEVVQHDSAIFPLGELPDLCACASDPSFEQREDMDKLRRETNSILFDDEDGEQGVMQPDA